jgi:phospholipase A1/A2
VKKIFGALIACALIAPVAAMAQETLRSCYEKHRDRDARLACYDALATASTPKAASRLAEEWLLDAPDVAHLRAHRPSYAVWRWTDNVNQTPSSPAPGHSVATPQQWQAGELKFQLSAKADIVRVGFDDHAVLSPLKLSGFDMARLWVAFTQQSNWQALNSGRSAAFRETNYEPEAVVTLRRRGASSPDKWFKLLNIGVVHQSNGQSLPESRSWNRFYVQGGFEAGRLVVLPRLSLRFRESDDDNPDLLRNIGRADVALHYGDLSLLLRSRLSRLHGYTELQYTPAFGRCLVGPASVFVQLTSGYGETLIDYNHRQSTIGVGLAYGGGNPLDRRPEC